MDTSAFWKVEFYDAQSCGPVQPNASYRTFFTGDTLINSITYSKIYTAGYTNCIQLGYAGALRNDSANRLVYYIEPDSIVEKVLYNFNLNLGDTVPYLYQDLFMPTTVIAIDSILINQEYRMRFMVDNSFAFLGPYFIEGIGSMNGLLPYYFSGETLYSLTCFSDSNNVVFPDTATSCFFLFDQVKEGVNRKKLNVFPNPTHGVFSLKGVEDNFIIILSDLNGKVIRSLAIKEHDVSFDFSELISGYYFVEVVDKDGNRRFSNLIIL